LRDRRIAVRLRFRLMFRAALATLAATWQTECVNNAPRSGWSGHERALRYQSRSTQARVSFAEPEMRQWPSTIDPRHGFAEPERRRVDSLRGPASHRMRRELLHRAHFNAAASAHAVTYAHLRIPVDRSPFQWGRARKHAVISLQETELGEKNFQRGAASESTR
jgi:hypothetical protein